MNIKKVVIFALILSLSAWISVGCSDKSKKTESTKTSLTEGGMKCGAGKCGASMVDGNTVLAKKKKNILSQMRDTDSRKKCVLSAKTSKSLYNCVRDPKTNRLTTKCGTDKSGDAKNDITMKCGAGKCGTGMTKAKVPIKEKVKKSEPAMKCTAGKCGGK